MRDAPSSRTATDTSFRAKQGGGFSRACEWASSTEPVSEPSRTSSRLAVSYPLMPATASTSTVGGAGSLRCGGSPASPEQAAVGCCRWCRGGSLGS